MWSPSESASANIHIFPYLNEEMSELPGITPIAVARFFISWDLIISSLSKSHVFKIFPLKGIIAWKDLSLACFAEPPAESPSTRNNSVLFKSSLLQSESLPGRAGPLKVFFLSTVFEALALAWAEIIANSAIFSPSSVCLLNHILSTSLVELLTNDICSFESSLSFVWPANCGFCIFDEITKIALLITSSALSFKPLGRSFLISQNSFIESSKPDLNPFRWDPPWAVGIKFTYVSSNLFFDGLSDQFITNSTSCSLDFFEVNIDSSNNKLVSLEASSR